MDKYSAKEIALARGMSLSTVRYRIRKLQLKMPCDYETVKQIITYRPVNRKAPHARPEAVNDLKLKLKNDGFRIAEK